MSWAKRLRVAPDELTSLVRLILDYYRRRGLVSHRLLQHRWSYSDVEVRKGLISVHRQFRPQGLVPTTRKSSFTKTWAPNAGRSGAQQILIQGLAGDDKVSADDRREFLEDLWDWLREQKLLVPATLTQKRSGKSSAIPKLSASTRSTSRSSASAGRKNATCATPAAAHRTPRPQAAPCPEYGCKGQLSHATRDEDHFDVHQYTRRRFVPLSTYEHSAQVPKEKRTEVEKEFKRETGGRYNCLVCTPTLEMGVDIGKLEMALMRNVPPTPANYAQRAGRAGRRHRIAAVFTYCRGFSSHDRYFFHDPAAMIAGEIRVPAFSMRNEPLIRKHAHSAILTALRELTTESEREILDQAFPPFIVTYFADMIPEGKKRRTKYLEKPRDVSGLAMLTKKYRSELLSLLSATFRDTWPEEERENVSEAHLGACIDEIADDLAAHVRRLFHQVQTYNKELGELLARQGRR